VESTGKLGVRSQRGSPATAGRGSRILSQPRPQPPRAREWLSRSSPSRRGSSPGFVLYRCVSDASDGPDTSLGSQMRILFHPLRNLRHRCDAGWRMRRNAHRRSSSGRPPPPPGSHLPRPSAGCRPRPDRTCSPRKAAAGPKRQGIWTCGPGVAPAHQISAHSPPPHPISRVAAPGGGGILQTNDSRYDQPASDQGRGPRPAGSRPDPPGPEPGDPAPPPCPPPSQPGPPLR